MSPSSALKAARNTAENTREDGSKLIILVVKCQAAHEYNVYPVVSALLGIKPRRSRQGILRRRNHQPPWCRMDGDEMVLIPEGVETIKKVFEYPLEGMGRRHATER